MWFLRFFKVTENRNEFVVGHIKYHLSFEESICDQQLMNRFKCVFNIRLTSLTWPFCFNFHTEYFQYFLLISMWLYNFLKVSWNISDFPKNKFIFDNSEDDSSILENKKISVQLAFSSSIQKSSRKRDRKLKNDEVG